MKCDKCHNELNEGDPAHGVSNCTVESYWLVPDDTPWIVFCPKCWVEITRMIWPSGNGGREDT